MSAAPKVSVVVATYNHERFLGAAIDSVLAQDYPQEALEVIVVDDGSTDGTPAVAARYGDRIRYIRKPNGGHLSTYDRGIGEATGDYIALLDGDDEWLPGKLRDQIELLESRPDLGMVHGDLRMIDGTGRVLADSFFAEHGIRHVEGELLPVLMRYNQTSTALVVRGSLRERFHPIPSWARAQDWWIALRVSEVAGIGCIHRPLINYRRHGANINNGRKGRRRAELQRAELPLRRWLLTEGMTAGLSGADTAAAFDVFETVVAAAAKGLKVSRRELLPIDDERRARAARHLQEGIAARADGDPDGATRHLVAALAHDPWNAAARRELTIAGQQGGWIAGPQTAVQARPVAAELAQPRLEGARAFTTLADATELIRSPELLAAYARTFSARDDATLVIRLGSDPEELSHLSEAVAAAGLEHEDAADLLAVPTTGPGARSLPYLAPRVDAVLSNALPEASLAALPCAAADGVGALARLARRVSGDAAAGPTFCINIGAPNWWSARSWGDLHFARAMQQELHRRGHACAIHVLDEWEASKHPLYDVVVHLKGLTAYEPDPAQTNVLWSISHPELLTVEECERYDLVLVASELYAAELADACSVPVHVLEQATDPSVFFPETDPELAHELVFVGNSRRVMRPIIADLLPTEHDLAIWGADWEPLIGSEHLVGQFLPNDRVRRAYSSAGIVLNDHWDDMRAHGYASNRLYDAVACGALVISDRLPGLEERFGGAVVTYEGREELAALVEHFLAHPEEAAARGAAGREVVLDRHTFAHRVDELLRRLDGLAAAPAALAA
jgi:hypothetical protein